MELLHPLFAAAPYTSPALLLFATNSQVPLDLLPKRCPLGMEKILDHFFLASPWVLGGFHGKMETSTAPKGRREAPSSSRSLWGSNFLMQVTDIITQGH